MVEFLDHEGFEPLVRVGGEASGYLAVSLATPLFRERGFVIEDAEVDFLMDARHQALRRLDVGGRGVQG